MAEPPELGLAAHVLAVEVFEAGGAGPVPVPERERRAAGIVDGAEAVRMELPTGVEAHWY